jgi:hypothetical protein
MAVENGNTSERSPECAGKRWPLQVSDGRRREQRRAQGEQRVRSGFLRIPDVELGQGQKQGGEQAGKAIIENYAEPVDCRDIRHAKNSRGKTEDDFTVPEGPSQNEQDKIMEWGSIVRSRRLYELREAAL